MPTERRSTISRSLILKYTGSLITALCLFLVSRSQSTVSYVDYVNPYMGNISHLLVPTYPTIHLPNSMLRVYPQREDYTGDRLNGLPLVVTSHRGRSAFNLSPYSGADANTNPVFSYAYDLEKLTPYAYSVYLEDFKINVGYGVSEQSALYQFNFEGKEAARLRLNASNGMVTWDGAGISAKQNIGNNTWVYLYAICDAAPVDIRVLKDKAWEKGNEASGRTACIDLAFKPSVKRVHLKYGISFISAQQAKANLLREIKGFDLNTLQQTGKRKWNEALSKISVATKNYNDRAVFYTSLYRTYERPVKISEDGQYFSAFDGKVHSDNGVPFYTDDWIWDSYRAHHPLNALIDPEKEKNILNSFIRMSEQMAHFWLPTFPEINGDSRRMNSNHGVATILDAYNKGIRGFDLKEAYRAAKGAITEKTLAPWSGKPAGELDRFFQEHGYIPALADGKKETIPEVNAFEKRQPVAVTLGTSYDLWCLAQIAKVLGYEEDYKKFSEQSFNYRNLFNPKTKFFHPKDSKGNFIEPFDYVFSGGQGARGAYGENNAWIYRWDVQHNIPDLVALMGGKEAFVNNLDEMFRQPLGRSKYDFYAQLPDHTGNVGQFSMANEPSLHIPYLYNYAGAPWMTQKRIKTLVREWFRNDLMGVPGDEDGGGMSSFVVFSQLGFYPVTPGKPVYSIGTPFFDNARLILSNGKQFVIKASNLSDDNKYIQSAKLNGRLLPTPEITHQQIMEGGVLEFRMGNRPGKIWNEK
ncbi:MAG: GH92 family glycosyl hydrolase [Niabella sp.]